MATKKPWRTVLTGTSTGRFTREQIRDAIDSVSSKSKAGGTESKAAGGASKSTKSAAGDKGDSASSGARTKKARDGTPE
jgi:hypothetical protein